MKYSITPIIPKPTKKNMMTFLLIILSAAICATLFVAAKPLEVKAAGDITIVGTIVKTRDYYNVNGPVCVYAFIPATLTEVQIGKKTVELTVCGAGTDTAALGTNDLSSFVGVTRAYTGQFGTGSTGPFKNTFVISSVADAPAVDYATIMTNHLTNLGYINVNCIEYAPGEVACTAMSPDFHCNFYYYMHNGVWGEINAVVANEDFSATDLGYGVEGYPAAGGFAKAQKVASIFAQYKAGTITKDAAQKSLNALQ